MKNTKRKPMENTYGYIKNLDGHVELISGNIYIENLTSPQHNIVVNHIADSIRSFIRENKAGCIVFTENVALLCDELTDGNNEGNFFLPDVMCVCPPAKVDDRGVHSVPHFVAEVTSKSTKTHDYCEKMVVYKNIGVQEYWVVDLQECRITVFLQERGFVPQYFLHPESLNVSVYPGLAIETEGFWKKP